MITLVTPRLILFAKGPRSGRVKTRLLPHCNARQAADLAELMIRETASLARSAWQGPIELCAWPDTGDSVVRSVAAQHELLLSQQSGGDLGTRMYKAMTASGYPSAVMGCDVPHCTRENLQEAYDLLSAGENIIGPSKDGGYYLLGLQRPAGTLFKGIPWGGEEVYGETRARARAAGIPLRDLVLMNDIDTIEDIRTVAGTMPELAKWLENLHPDPHIDGNSLPDGGTLPSESHSS